MTYEQRQQIIDQIQDAVEQSDIDLNLKSNCPETLHVVVDGETVAEITIKNLEE